MTIRRNNSWAQKSKPRWDWDWRNSGNYTPTPTEEIVIEDWTPQNVVLTAITGGIRITWTADATAETEIWLRINQGTYYLLTTVAPNIGTYDYMCDAGADFDFKLKFKIDSTVLNAPVISSALISGGARVTITDTNSGIALHEVYGDIGGGYILMTTLALGVFTYDYINAGVNVVFKVRAKEGTLPVYSSYSNITGSLSIPITDIDDNVYTLVTIGTQTWMVENLMTTKYRNGDSIPNPADGSWNGADDAYKWYNNSVGNKTLYGALYSKKACIDVRNIAPVGFHVPSAAEWATLSSYLGGDTVSGGELKESGTVYWSADNGDHSSGFKARGGGYINENNGTSALQRTHGKYHDSSAYSVSYTNEYTMLGSGVALIFAQISGKRGLSIRCIKD